MTCKKKPHDFNSINIIVLIIDLRFIYFISDLFIMIMDTSLGIIPYIIANKLVLEVSLSP